VTAIPTLIAQAAPSYGVNPNFALAIANQESGFNQSAVGSSGEQGVFQLMPGTAAQLGVDPSDLNQNIAGGLSYQSQLLARYGGNYAMAAAAYNAGPGAVDAAIAHYGSNWMAGLPPGTVNYVNSVLPAAGMAGTSSAPGGISTPSAQDTPSPTLTLSTDTSADGSPGMSSLSAPAMIAIGVGSLALLYFLL
jgi:hypothetical protein